MSRYLIFCLFLILLACKSSNQNPLVPLAQGYPTSSKAEDSSIYKINKITPYGYTYIIQAEREGVIYFIVTQNDRMTNLQCNSPIKEGEFYSLILTMLYPEYKGGETYGRIIGGTDISGVFYNGTIIPFNEFSGSCYTTSSLKGLCLLKDYYLKTPHLSEYITPK